MRSFLFFLSLIYFVICDETTTVVTTVDTTTGEVITTTTEEETTTTAELTTTTENPANFPKDGTVELLVEDIVYSGNMLHWSANNNDLSIADIWGQLYLRFKEKDPVTTTIAPETTTTTTTVGPTTSVDPNDENSTIQRSNSRLGGEFLARTTTSAADTTTTEVPTTTTTEVPTTTTTEVPTTTAEPLPYDVNYMTVTKDVVYLTRPREKTEGAFPFIVPLVDEFNLTETNSINAVIGFNEKLHIANWDLNLTESIQNLTATDWYRNSEDGRMDLKNFNIPSPVWVDPNGRMVIGSHDIRPFKIAGRQKGQFFIFFNSFDAEKGFRELSEFSHLPYGMAWSLDNQTLYYSDGFSKSIVKCFYNLKRAEVSDCEELLDISQEYETAIPRGMATDMNDHIWLALAENDEKGAVIEIDPETKTIISTIDVDDKNLVDLKFGGSDLDFLYLLSEKHLYKVEGMGVTGKEVLDFVWRPDI